MTLSADNVPLNLSRPKLHLNGASLALNAENLSFTNKSPALKQHQYVQEQFHYQEPWPAPENHLLSEPSPVSHLNCCQLTPNSTDHCLHQQQDKSCAFNSESNGTDSRYEGMFTCDSQSGMNCISLETAEHGSDLSAQNHIEVWWLVT